MKRGHPIAVPQRGLSLVELLVATSLGVLVVGALGTIFVGNQRSSDLNDALVDMQESARFALGSMARDVRMAGYRGCLDGRNDALTSVALNGPTADLRRTAISGAHIQADGQWKPAPQLGVGSSAFTAPATLAAVTGTDTLAVQYGTNPARRLVAAQRIGGEDTPAGPLEVGAPSVNRLGLTAGDFALVTTCEAGEIFTVTDVSPGGSGAVLIAHGLSGNATASLAQNYGAEAMREQARVMRLATWVYYIGDTGRTNEQGDAISSLYQYSLPFDEANNPPIELIEGVEMMRVRFGMASANGQLRYVAANDAAFDPTRVKTVQLGLLLVSHDALADATDSTTYRLAGQAIAPGTANDAANHRYAADRRVRLAFNTTISVRNRRVSEHE